MRIEVLYACVNHCWILRFRRLSTRDLCARAHKLARVANEKIAAGARTNKKRSTRASFRVLLARVSRFHESHLLTGALAANIYQIAYKSRVYKTGRRCFAFKH